MKEKKWGAVELLRKGRRLGLGGGPTRLPKINKIRANTQTCGHLVPTRQVPYLSDLRASGTANLLTKDMLKRFHIVCVWVAQCLPHISYIDL